MIEELVEQHHINALAITPLDCLLVETKINELIDQRGIPVVMFNTDLPNSHRLCYVGQENLSSGRTVAELSVWWRGRAARWLRSVRPVCITVRTANV